MFNGNPVIDPFDRGPESPISDGGRWYSPMIGGGTTPGLGGDYQETHIWPLPSLNVSIKHQNWDDVLHPPPGPAYAIRIASPGASRNHEISMFGTGLFGDAYRLLRFDLNGNGYVCLAQAGGLGTAFSIWKSTAWNRTLIASNSVNIGAGNLYIGARADGDIISVWYRDVYEPTNGPYHLGVDVVDTSYYSGYLGFGSSGGVFGTFFQQPLYGRAGWVSELFTPNILIPYNKPIPVVGLGGGTAARPHLSARFAIGPNQTAV